MTGRVRPCGRQAAFVLCILPMLAAAAPLRPFPFDYDSIQEELSTGVANHVELKQVCDTPVVYRAWGVRLFRYPAEDVAGVALDFEHYPRIFRHVYSCVRIAEPPNRISPLGTWYLEGRAAIARVWAIGNIDTLCWDDSSHLRFIATQNEDRRLEKKWNQRKRGWINFRTHGVHLAAFIVPAGRDSSRLGVVAQGWVEHPMPEWLVRLTMRIVLPQLLQDIDDEVARRAEARRGEESTWGKWYRAARRLLPW